MGFCVKKKEQKPVSFQKDKKKRIEKNKTSRWKKTSFPQP